MHTFFRVFCFVAFSIPSLVQRKWLPEENTSYCLILKCLYWDSEKLTYVLAPTAYENYPGMQQCNSNPRNGNKETESGKQDKVKVAKKIAKDMERWAKTLNQKKESTTSRVQLEPGASNYGYGAASADIGFFVLEKKSTGAPINPVYIKNEIPENPSQSAPLVAEYGGESESSGEEESINDETDYLDYAKLICNLCKRQLGSAEALKKHAKLSTLHKQNLEARKVKKKPEQQKIVYRDRAKERRMKYGDPDEPQPSKLKEYLKSREMADIPAATSSVMEPISTENVGNKLLQKMGWAEGQGLGKSNQGRTSIMQVEQRSSTVGLGNKSSQYSALAGESYKDCVKKMMYARYQELSENEK